MACKHHVLRMALISALLATGFSVAPALAEKRLALVIGNDRYPNLSAERQLQKAANDAQAVGDALGKIGFQVIRGVNLTRQGMIDKLSELTARLEPGDTAAFFYAGHGVAIGGVNYLVPTDVPAVSPDAESRLRGASIAEGDVVAEIQGKGVRVALFVLDACRDNPFPRSGTRAVGGTRGLADAKPVRGIFTIYSAGIGQSALDRLEPNDPNRNSVFTRVLIQELGNPGVDLGGLAIEVRERVAELALKAKDDSGQSDPHEQTPAYYDQTIGGRVYLAGLAKPQDEPPVAPRSLVLSQPVGQRLDMVTECDRLAGAVTDVQRPPSVEGVPADKIDIVPALRACNDAMREYPDVARFAFQAGRVAHIQKDYGLARQLYESAIARGNVVAMTNLANLHSGGLGMTRDNAEARRLYEQAAATGEPVAMYNLGNFYEHGTGVAKDYAEARRWYEKSAAGGVAISMNAIGLMHEYGYGVNKNYGEARQWYEKAAAAGYAASMTNIGLAYANGRGVAQDDHAEARRWYDKAAAAGDARAMNVLGFMYQRGNNVAQDYVEARKWYEKAAIGGNSYAMNNLGVLYENGNGVAKDYVEARQWYERAAAQNHTLAMANLGYLYETGHGVTSADPAMARSWYQKSADAGDGRAMNLLGMLYHNGKGVAKDYGEARKWYEKSAAANYAAAMSNLGILYEFGNGVDQSYADALKWYNKSAALNDANAMYHLGNMNRDGKGVARDAAEARKWYEKAAAAGSEPAKTALEKLGSGGPGSTGGSGERAGEKASRRLPAPARCHRIVSF